MAAMAPTTTATGDPIESPVTDDTADGGAIAPADLLASMPFAVACGVEIEQASADEVRGGLDWVPERCTIAGAMHGGALMAMADSLGAVCAFLNLPPGALTSTIESKTNFFRGVRHGRAHATSTPLHVGRSTIVVQTDIRDDDGRRVALVTQTQAVSTV
jgi:1,4-dihydroxy-2-naphthoyl-CoA hydrolase